MSKRSKKPLAIIDLDVRDDLKKLRSAGQLLRQTWRRNAIYQFLNTVYAVHSSWRTRQTSLVMMRVRFEVPPDICRKRYVTKYGCQPACTRSIIIELKPVISFTRSKKATSFIVLLPCLDSHGVFTVR
jgi:hypothetical protein